MCLCVSVCIYIYMYPLMISILQNLSFSLSPSLSLSHTHTFTHAGTRRTIFDTRRKGQSDKATLTPQKHGQDFCSVFHSCEYLLPTRAPLFSLSLFRARSLAHSLAGSRILSLCNYIHTRTHAFVSMYVYTRAHTRAHTIIHSLSLSIYLSLALSRSLYLITLTHALVHLRTHTFASCLSIHVRIQSRTHSYIITCARNLLLPTLNSFLHVCEAILLCV